MLGDAFAYPRKGESWLKTVVIGGLLVFFAWLFVPLLLLQGYLMRVLKHASEGRTEPPAFGEWFDLLIDGAKLLLVTVAYFLVPILLLVAVEVVVDLGVVGAVLVTIAYGAAAYLLPAGLTNMAREGTIGAGFDFGVVTDVAGSTDYLIAVVLAILVGTILGAIATLLSAVLVGVFLLFYVQVMVYYLWARGFAAGVEGTAETTSDVTGAPGTTE